jgi:hypothetical protein
MEYRSTLKLEAAVSSETSEPIYQNTWCHIAEHRKLDQSDNFKLEVDATFVS